MEGHGDGARPLLDGEAVVAAVAVDAAAAAVGVMEGAGQISGGGVAARVAVKAVCGHDGRVRSEGRQAVCE